MPAKGALEGNQNAMANMGTTRSTDACQQGLHCWQEEEWAYSIEPFLASFPPSHGFNQPYPLLPEAVFGAATMARATSWCALCRCKNEKGHFGLEQALVGTA
jgi:hypothetical protein